MTTADMTDLSGTSPKHYTGRFAPSPTGPLHQGSLISALASYLEAKSHYGRWLVRIEDLDPPRELAGASEAILQALQQHGLYWDGEILKQSEQHHRYQAAIERLLTQGIAYYCHCSRTEISAQGGIYQGKCRHNHQPHPSLPCAIRVNVDHQNIHFDDAIQGHISQQLDRELGDFVIQRKDGFFAYQLAVVLDDDFQGITHVMRGSDLLDSTPRQIYLQQRLGLAQPHYGHIPVMTNRDGQKLSKQTFAPALNTEQAASNLLQALKFLRQPLPPNTSPKNCSSILQWALEHWSIDLIPPTLSICEDSLNS